MDDIVVQIEDGRIISQTPNGVFELVNNQWVKPTEPVSAEDLMNGTPVSI